MALKGHSLGLIDEKHATGCTGQEFCTCRPVVVDSDQEPGDEVVVVFMVWCSDCHAADYEVV